jgi:hypothetical protein
VEESEYKSTYNDLASVRCVFEKTLTNHRAKCHLAKHFCLADREGYSCEDPAASLTCKKLLEILRKKSIFVLKLRDVDGPLPHNMEIRVQVGGITGLAKQLDLKAEQSGECRADNAKIVEDISAVVDRMIVKFGSLEALPYSEIIQSVVQFQGRRRRR